MHWLDEELEAYAETDAYPMHMPGHKRRSGMPMDPYAMDITEIDGFDNLHHAEGIIKDLMNETAAVYGAEKAYLLVNGSTVGNLAMILAATEPGDKIIAARNCHKSVYNAMYLNRLRSGYVYPKALDCGILGPVTAEDVKEALEKHPDAKAVMITSPSYEGIVTDLKSAADEVHKAGALLLVDGAHGAHFGFHEYFPASMMDSGADAIVVSLHKTLPAFTMTAALLIPPKSSICIEKLERYLGMLQSSSPSYILMAQAARCIRMLKGGPAVFEAYAGMLKNFYRQAADLEHIYVLREKGMDPSKIVIMSGESGLSGEELMEILREEYHIELEMCGFDHALAMTSVCDTPEGLDRLNRALHEIDKTCAGAGRKAAGPKVEVKEMYSNALLYSPREKNMEPWEAVTKKREEIPLSQACGRCAAEPIRIYPPGIPFVNGGEIITEEVIEYIQSAAKTGLTLEGGSQGTTVSVIVSEH